MLPLDRPSSPGRPGQARSILVCTVALLLAVTGCGLLPGQQKAEGVERATTTVAGVEREFSVFIPDGTAGDGRPVVIYLHGHGDNMRHILGEGLVPSASSVWMSVARREGVLVLYPLGLEGDGARSRTGWNDCRQDAEGNPSEDDVAFIEQLIDLAVEEYGGDRSRVYVTGMSNGGHMATRVGLELADQVAAIAPIAALMPTAHECPAPSVPVPVMLMHGTDDPLAPFDGGAMAGDRGDVLSFGETAETWVEWNGVGDQVASSFELEDLDERDDSIMVGVVQGQDPDGVAVLSYVMQGAGHTEPSRVADLTPLQEVALGPQNRDVEMAELVWEFFSTRSR